VFATNNVRSAGEVSVSGTATIEARGARLSAVTRYPGRWLAFAVVLLADVMDLVDSTVTNVGGPAIRADLGGGDTLLQWLGAAYTLAFAVLLVTGARLGALYGRRRLFLIGAAGFTAASAACALAWSPEVLIALRAVQRAFGALMIPQGFGMMKETLADDELPTAFAVFGPVMGLSAVLGPIIGVLLIEGDILGSGWRAIFLVNVPLGLVALGVGARYMPRTVAARGGGLDLPGMALIGVAALALVYPLIEGGERGWPTWTFVVMAAGVGLVALFAAYERRRPPESALVQVSLMKNRALRPGWPSRRASSPRSRGSCSCCRSSGRWARGSRRSGPPWRSRRCRSAW
jgi:MFS family permease